MDSQLAEIYHERQVRELCALHALNNLFQDKKAFSKKDLDEICINLSPESFINPHRSMLGFGNYDVNVLMAAVQMKECETVWFDKRKSTKCLVAENIFGFILNTPSDYKFGFFHLPFKRKHWICFRQIGGVYYNLDSKLSAPEIIGDENLLLDFLDTELKEGDKELLLVVTKEIASACTWKQQSETEAEKTENGQLTTDSMQQSSTAKTNGVHSETNLNGTS